MEINSSRSEPWHGTNNGYSNHGCRCDDCKEACRRYQRAYYAEHREHKKALARAWANQNPARRRAIGRKWAEENPEKCRASRKKWEEANPDHPRSGNTRRARKKGVPREWWRPADILERDGGRCGLCGDQVDPNNFHVDHVLPISRGGDDTKSNLQLAHPPGNHKKSFKTMNEYADYLAERHMTPREACGI